MYNYQKEIEMIKITTVEAREKFSEIVNKTAFGAQRIVLTRRGKEVAAVVPIDDLKKIEMASNSPDVAEAMNALAAALKSGAISWDDVKRQLKPRKTV